MMTTKLKVLESPTAWLLSRSIMLVLNPIFSIAGLVMIILGSLVVQTVSLLEHWYPQQAKAAAAVLVFVGCALVVTSALGFWGTYDKILWAMKVYAAVMLVIFCFQLSGSITSYAYRYHLKEPIHHVNKTFMLYNGNLNSNETLNARRDLDQLQSKLRCCGLEGYDDWDFKYPQSCFCHKDSSIYCSGDGRNNDLNIFNRGCFDVLHHYLELHDAAAGIGITVAFFELLCVVCSVALISSFTAKDDQIKTLPVSRSKLIDDIVSAFDNLTTRKK